MLIFFCFPDLSYAWTFNDNPLYVQEDNRRFVSQETGNLYIAKVEPSDVGNYTCFITNKEAQRSVQGPPTPLVQRTDGKMMSYLGNILSLLRPGDIYWAFSFPLVQRSHIINELRFNLQIWWKSDTVKKYNRKFYNSLTWYSLYDSGYIAISSLALEPILSLLKDHFI